MNDYLYFLSYARDDRRNDSHDCIGTFRKDLAEEVRRIRGSVEGRVGFFDSGDIESGNDWPHKISEALSTCRVFVPIYSPTYFAQDYCGREWKIFSDRLKEFKKQYADAKIENLIQPVLLVPPHRLLNHWTDAASRIQHTDEEYPLDYTTEGLHAIATATARAYENIYERFIRVLAGKIVDAAEECSLPPLDRRPDIQQTISAFDQNKPIPDPNPMSETSGPRFVEFIFVAGKRNELQGIRETLDYYGDEGGLDWKPFLPEVPDKVSRFATEVASEEDLWPERITLDEKTIDRGIIDVLEAAENRNNIVVIIVDTWTLRLEKYRTFIRPYDNRVSFNCVVLIPWNLHCNQTEEKKEDLEREIKQTFPRKWIGRDKEGRFLASINSLDELKKDLTEALNDARELISRYHKVKGGETESISMKPKPTIRGPGG